MSSFSDVLCDAGPLIAISKLNRLEVLAELYGKILIPRPVYDEVVTSTEFLINEISIRRDIWISSKLCEQVLNELRK